jgi:hypothetical protein
MKEAISWTVVQDKYKEYLKIYYTKQPHLKNGPKTGTDKWEMQIKKI